jgi:NADH-quinone oxidoreductase subunit F
MSIPFRELIDKHCGGIRGGWDNLLAVIPGGSSVPLLPASRSSTRLWISTRCATEIRPRHRGGDRHGQVDRHHQGDRAARYFYKHESCGQCTPCREGTGWMWRVMERMVKGECRSEKSTCCWTSPSRWKATRSARSATRRLADPGPDPAFPSHGQ